LPLIGSLVLCHSQMRSAEMTQFTTELTAFCDEIVEVVNFDESVNDTLAKLRLIYDKEPAADAEGTMAFKKSVVLIGTPGNFVNLLRGGKLQLKYHSVVLDKVDLLQAMDFKDELTEIGSSLKDLVNGKIIFTTNVKDDKDQGIDE